MGKRSAFAERKAAIRANFEKTGVYTNVDTGAPSGTRSNPTPEQQNYYNQIWAKAGSSFTPEESQRLAQYGTLNPTPAQLAPLDKGMTTQTMGVNMNMANQPIQAPAPTNMTNMTMQQPFNQNMQMPNQTGYNGAYANSVMNPNISFMDKYLILAGLKPDPAYPNGPPPSQITGDDLAMINPFGGGANLAGGLLGKAAVKTIAQDAVKFAAKKEADTIIKGLTSAGSKWTTGELVNKVSSTLFNKGLSKNLAITGIDVSMNTAKAGILTRVGNGLVKLATNPFVILGVVSGAVSSSLGGKAWAGWAEAESMDALNMAQKKYYEAGDIESANKVLGMIEETADKTVWETLGSYVPFYNVMEGNARKAAANLESAKATQKAEEKKLADEAEKQQHLLDKTPDEFGQQALINQDALQADEAKFNTEQNTAFNQGRLDTEREAAAIKVQAAKDAAEAAAQAYAEAKAAASNGGSSYTPEDLATFAEKQRIAYEYWLKQQEEYKKMYEERTPSNLKFGLL